jgi:hypothetical protein
MSTSINDLPTDGSITLTINDDQQQQQQQGISLDENTISQIVSGIQKAHLSGATMLPSRDIPMHSDHIMTDEQASNPNFIPKPSVTDYVNEYDNDLNNYYKQEQNNRSLDVIYDELQAPVLLGVLYFLFQLPILKNLLFKYLPFLCHSDGNYNLNGLVFTCSLFGLIYYSLSRFVKSFSRF